MYCLPAVLCAGHHTGRFHERHAELFGVVHARHHDQALGRIPLAYAARLPKRLDVFKRPRPRGAFVRKIGPASVLDVHWPEDHGKVVVRHCLATLCGATALADRRSTSAFHRAACLVVSISSAHSARRARRTDKASAACFVASCSDASPGWFDCDRIASVRTRRASKATASLSRC